MLLQKGVYPYDYMNDWEKFNETSSPEKEDFYSHLNIGDITDAGYTHARIKKLGEYHGLYVHCNTYLLADAFNNII